MNYNYLKTLNVRSFTKLLMNQVLQKFKKDYLEINVTLEMYYSSFPSLLYSFDNIKSIKMYFYIFFLNSSC